MTEAYFDRERVKELAIILVFWNIKELSDSEALAKIKELFKTEFHQYWTAYNKKDFLVWAKQIGVVRKQTEKD